MYNEIREHVEHQFAAAPRTPRAYELQEELICNLYEKYDDLIRKGETPEVAHAITISGIGDIDDLIAELQKSADADPAYREIQQKKSALYVSLGIALLIASPIFLIIFGYLASEVADFFIVVGFALTLSFIAAGVGLLVFNHKIKSNTQPPYYMNTPDASSPPHNPNPAGRVDPATPPAPEHNPDPAWAPTYTPPHASDSQLPPFYKTVQKTIYTASVPLYLILGFLFHVWHPGWLIFVLCPLLAQLVRLVFLYTREESLK